jgi:hypothetical protein
MEAIADNDDPNALWAESTGFSVDCAGSSDSAWPNEVLTPADAVGKALCGLPSMQGTTRIAFDAVFQSGVPVKFDSRYTQCKMWLK